jgi:tetraacyldisaccharide 4'-kinase
MKLPWLLRLLLWPLSLVYGAVVRLRVLFYERGWLKQARLNAPVISVGNLTVGGTGKTPLVIWLATRLLGEGKRVAILSRGYHGKNGTSDEVELAKYRLQNRVAFGVGKRRYIEGRRIEAAQEVDVFLLDDGFQHLQLARDLDILLMDTSRALGGEELLPAGPLREPLAAMKRANVLVFTRTETAAGATGAIAKLREYPVFAASTQLLGFRCWGGDVAVLPKEQIGDGPFLAFCGIGNPDAFFKDLENWNLKVASKKVFPDHHRYTPSDLDRLQNSARQSGAVAFLTTEKDAQNLSGLELNEMPVYLALIDLAVSPEAEFWDIIQRTVSANPGRAA